MFGKLLKHELKASWKTQLILSISSLLAGLIGCLVMWLMLRNTENSGEVIMTVFVSFTFLLGMLLVVLGCAIASSILLWVRFYKNKYSDEGYLTFTLPASTHQILLSSITNIAIWNVIMSIVAIFSMVLIFLPIMLMASKEVGADLYSEVSVTVLEETLGYSLLMQLIGTVCSFIYNLTLPLLCITLGSIIAKKLKLLASFGLYLGISFGISIITSIITGTITISTLASGNETGDALYTIMMAIPYAIYLIIGIASYFIMHHLADKKLNLP